MEMFYPTFLIILIPLKQILYVRNPNISPFIKQDGSLLPLGLENTMITSNHPGTDKVELGLSRTFSRVWIKVSREDN